jgi:glucosamine-6-phosphate deaminase
MAELRVHRLPDAEAVGAAAAARGAERLRAALARQASVTVVLATGASQFGLLHHLTRAPGLNWSRVEVFHLDEYIGLPADHPAAFRRYLRDRFLSAVTPGAFHAIAGDAPDPEAECARLATLLASRTVEVLFLGIGENGHLAFNDPPADVRTTRPYLVAPLDEACRRQQLGEGWFASLDDVPRRAITMSVREILRARALVCTVPDARKAVAVRDALEGPLCPACPASFLRLHPEADVYLDPASSALLAASPA